MRKIIYAATLSFLLTAYVGNASAANGIDRDAYASAVRLYRNGMYVQAREMFDAVAAVSPDAMNEGYSILCALQMKEMGHSDALEVYQNKYGVTPLTSRMRFLMGLNFFDDGKYLEAGEQFAMVPEKSLSRKMLSELVFKKAYCDFGQEHYEKSESGFRRVEKMPYSGFTAPSRYALGYIAYTDKKFEEAFGWFSKSSGDARFEQISKYYMLECRFLQQDYRYVVTNGEEIFKNIPEDRRPHLARILSESYLVLGNAGKAKEYYDKNILSKPMMNRSDYFYAGSLQYALCNFEEAIDNYSMMPMRTDSIGQIANYQLAYSYIQTKKKVSAMDSFEQAAGAAFDTGIQEDAYFNYAKLAFDLNHDGQPFRDYLSKFPDSGKKDLIYSYIAFASLYNHDYAGAVESYDCIDELSDEMKLNYMKANYLRAQQLVASGSYRDAAENLRAATFFSERQDNFNKLARYWLAECYYKMERYSEAQNIYEDLYNQSALDHQEEGKLLPYDIAYSSFRRGDYATASKWFDRYLSSRHMASREDAGIRRADCDFLRRDYKNAIVSYGKVIGEYGSPDKIYPYYQLGMSYGLSGNNNQKITTLEEVWKASPSSAYYCDALFELGRAYVAVGKSGEAEKSFEALANSSKDNSFVAKGLIELGMISRNSKNYDKALGYYQKVVETLPAGGYTEDALLAIESIYQAKGTPGDYFSYLEKIGESSRKSESEKEQVYFNSAEQLFLSENYQKAISGFNEYLELFPSGVSVSQAFYYLGDCYNAIGKKEKACDCYARVMAVTDTGSVAELATLNFAVLSYGLEHFTESFEAYSSLLQIASLENNRHAARIGMMRSAFRSKNLQSAIKCSEAVVGDDASSDAEIREAKYLCAQSYLATSQRVKAFEIFRELALCPDTDEGAEASYLIIQDAYDEGDFSSIENLVYNFAESAPNQSYWLAKSFIVLGDTFVEKNNLSQAKATFESVLNGYTPVRGSSDDILDNVRLRMEKLVELM